MFDSPADAREVLQAYFDTPRLERVVEALVPTVVFETTGRTAAGLGETRFGGEPDLPRGTVWPRPPAPEDIEAFVQRAGQRSADELRRSLALGLPYAFIAQIDLAEASTLGPVTSALPPDGRLLFFYDIAVGPWDTGTRAARVVWDRSPRQDLSPMPTPPDLAEAAKNYAREMAEIRAKVPRAGEPKEEGTPYGAPAQPLRLKSALRLPDPHGLEIAALPELAAAYRGKPVDDAADFGESYREAVEETQARADGKVRRRQQALGSPQSEQDDPRYDAVVVSAFGKQHLSSDEWKARAAEIQAKAGEWRLLLQIDLGDWMKADLVEGTVYFVIRESDLAQRRFDRVVAVYQQT